MVTIRVASTKFVSAFEGNMALYSPEARNITRGRSSSEIHVCLVEGEQIAMIRPRKGIIVLLHRFVFVLFLTVI